MVDFQETADRLSLRFPGLKIQADLENSDIVVGQDIAELLGVELSVYIRLATNGERWFSYHSLVNQRGDDITRLTRSEEATAEAVLRLALDGLITEIEKQKTAVDGLKKGSAKAFREVFDKDKSAMSEAAASLRRSDDQPMLDRLNSRAKESTFFDRFGLSFAWDESADHAIVGRLPELRLEIRLTAPTTENDWDCSIYLIGLDEEQGNNLIGDWQSDDPEDALEMALHDAKAFLIATAHWAQRLASALSKD